MSEEIDASNVDQCIYKALDKYSENGMILDILFWSRIFSVLQRKYNFTLENKSK